MVALVDDPCEQGEQRAGDAAGDHGERRCPQLLADGAEVGQERAGEHEAGADDEEPLNLVVEVAQVHDDLTHAEADEHMAQGGQRGEDALRVGGVPLVGVVGAQHGVVDDGEDVGGVVGIAVAQLKNDVIAHEQEGDDPRNETVVDRQGDDGGQAVADAQPRQYAEDALMAQQVAEALPRRWVDEAVGALDEHRDGDADEPQQQGALQHLPGAGPRPGEVELTQREVGGDAHDEHERWEDEVGGREAYPVGVFEGREALGATGVVDQNHAGDGEAAQDVDGQDALALLRCG